MQRILADGPLPTLAQRRYPPYLQIAEPRQRRLAIVHLYFDGWNIKSIAGYLETTRPRVYETLRGTEHDRGARTALSLITKPSKL